MREQFLVNAERRRFASNSDDGDSGCAMGEYTWVPPGLKTAELIHKYYSRIPEGKIPYVDTIGERYRVHQLLLQLPPHDSDPRYCQNLTEAEKREFQLFIAVRKEKASGRGTVVHITNSEQGTPVNCAKCAQPIAHDSIAVLCHRLLAPSSVKRSPDPFRNTSQLASGKSGVVSAMAASVQPAARQDMMAAKPKRQLSNKPSSPNSYGVTPNTVDNQGVFKSGEDIPGRGGIFHPECFVCNKCSELLIDLTYFFHNGALFCGRHYCEQIRPRCTACDEIIFADECTEADGRSWHVHHFLCSQCERNLGGDKYILRDGHPYCCTCFDNLFAELCETCSDPIGVDEGQMAHDGQHWHSTPECFCCQICKCSLLGRPFLPKYGNIFCSVDCAKCFSSNGLASDCKKTGAGCGDDTARSKCLKEATELVSSEKGDVHDRKCPFSSVYSTTTAIGTDDNVMSVDSHLGSPCVESSNFFNKPHRNLTVTFDDQVVVNHIVSDSRTMSQHLKGHTDSTAHKECFGPGCSQINCRGHKIAPGLCTVSSVLDKCVQCDLNAVDKSSDGHQGYCPHSNAISARNNRFSNERGPCATGNGCVSSNALMEVEAAELARQQPIDAVCCESATVDEHVEGDSYVRPWLNESKVQTKDECELKDQSNDAVRKSIPQCSFALIDPYTNKAIFKQGLHQYGSVHHPIGLDSTSLDESTSSVRKECRNRSKVKVNPQTLKSADNGCRLLTDEPIYATSSSERRVSHSFEDSRGAPGGRNGRVPGCVYKEGMFVSDRGDKLSTELSSELSPVAVYSSIFDTGSWSPDAQNMEAASKLTNDVTDTRTALPRGMEKGISNVHQGRKVLETHTEGIGHLLTDAGIDRLFHQEQSESKIDRCVDCSCNSRQHQLANPELPVNGGNVLPATLVCDQCKSGPETSHFVNNNDMTQHAVSCKHCLTCRSHNVRTLRRAFSSTAFDPYRRDGDRPACSNRRGIKGLAQVSNFVAGGIRPVYLCQQVDKQASCLGNERMSTSPKSELGRNGLTAFHSRVSDQGTYAPMSMRLIRPTLHDEECGVRNPTANGRNFDELWKQGRTSTARTGCTNPYSSAERPGNVPVVYNLQHYHVRDNCTLGSACTADVRGMNQCTARCCRQSDGSSSDVEEGDDSIDSAWELPCSAFKNCKYPNKQVDQPESNVVARSIKPLTTQKFDAIESKRKNVVKKKPNKSRRTKNDISAEEFPLMNVKIRENFDVGNYRMANDQRQSRTPPIMHVPTVEVCSDWTANYCPPPSLPTNQLVNPGSPQCRYSTSLSSKSARAGSDTCINHGVRIIYYEDDMSMCSGLALQSDGTRFEPINKLKGIDDNKQSRNVKSLTKQAGRSLLPAALGSKTKGTVASSRKTIQRCGTTLGQEKPEILCGEVAKKDYQAEENIYETALNKPISSGKSARSAATKMSDRIPSSNKRSQSQQSQHHCSIS